MNTQIPSRRNLLYLCITAALFVRAPSARCDVTLLTEVRITHSTGGAAQGDPSPEKSTARILFKGKMARYEGPDGRVVLYDGVKGRVYTLNADEKTYRSQSVKEAWKTNDPMIPSSPQGVDFDVNVKLNKTDTVETKAGLSAQRFEVTGSAKTQTPQSSGNRSSGGMGRGGGRGRRGGGGFPGGGYPSGGSGGGGDTDGSDQGGSYSGRRGRPRVSVQIEGEVWLAGDASLPDAKLWTISALVGRTIPQGLLLKAAVDKLNHLKQVPVASNLTFHFQGAGQPQDPITIATEVQSIAQGTVDDALFSVPADYHMSSAP
jgi:hypothetical protein